LFVFTKEGHVAEVGRWVAVGRIPDPVSPQVHKTEKMSRFTKPKYFEVLYKTS
jgi:hypothetical protein